MSVQTRIETNNSLSARRNTNQHTRRTNGYRPETGVRKAEPKLNMRPFLDNFYFEHSVVSACLSQVADSDESGIMKSTAGEACRTRNQNSPNCVYIG